MRIEDGILQKEQWIDDLMKLWARAKGIGMALEHWAVLGSPGTSFENTRYQCAVQQ